MTWFLRFLYQGTFHSNIMIQLSQKRINNTFSPVTSCSFPWKKSKGPVPWVLKFPVRHLLLPSNKNKHSINIKENISSILNNKSREKPEPTITTKQSEIKRLFISFKSEVNNS